MFLAVVSVVLDLPSATSAERAVVHAHRRPLFYICLHHRTRQLAFVPWIVRRAISILYSRTSCESLVVSFPVTERASHERYSSTDARHEVSRRGFAISQVLLRAGPAARPSLCTRTSHQHSCTPALPLSLALQPRSPHVC